MVNDGSVDATSSIARRCGASVLDLPRNKGAGYATRVGCDLAHMLGAETIVTIDGDGQHNPADIPLATRLISENKADIVFGCRPRNCKMPLVKRIGSAVLASLALHLYGVSIPDTQTGFHAFRSPVFPELRWRSCRYAFVSEICCLVTSLAKVTIHSTSLEYCSIISGQLSGSLSLLNCLAQSTSSLWPSCLQRQHR